MATTRTPRLATLFDYLRRRAIATGADQSADLFHGARLAVRARDGAITLTVSRRDKPVGATEISTFLAHCAVPATAQRWPSEGQGKRDADGVTWHYVSWRWNSPFTEQQTDEATS